MITIRDGVRLTRMQQELIAAANRELEAGRWERLPQAHCVTLRWESEDIPTPDHARKPFNGNEPLWGGDTYQRVLFLDIITGKPWSMLLATHACPWVSARQGLKIGYAKALEILANPQSVWGK